MKAVRYTRYGPPEVLTVEDIERPAPVGNQVLIKVRAASINALEWRAMGSNPLLMRMIGGNLKRPKNPRVGTDVAGVVEAVGAEVSRFKPGDAVFGCATGAFAEYVLAREANLAIKPDRATFEQAAAVPVAGLTALQGLRMEGGIKPGEKVLIQGASGGVGVFAVQLAKYSGGDVTAVVSTRNL